MILCLIKKVDLVTAGPSVRYARILESRGQQS
jgi:hypothetical protein